MPRLSKNLEDSLERERDQYAKNLQVAAIEASTDGENFLTLFSAPNPTYLGNEVQQFEVDTVHKYNSHFARRGQYFTIVPFHGSMVPHVVKTFIRHIGRKHREIEYKK